MIRSHIYRIDKFKVPPAARAEFLERTQDTHRLLQTLRGFVRSALFEQASGPGNFNFVTLVEWESTEAVEAAQESVAATYRKAGFNPQELRARLGIEADVGVYSEVPLAVPLQVA